MSVLTQFAGGGVKSVQRGTILMAPNVIATSVTIAAVNPSKTMVNLLGFSVDEVRTALTSTFMRIELSSSTTVSLLKEFGTVSATRVSYEVIEFY